MMPDLTCSSGNLAAWYGCVGRRAASTFIWRGRTRSITEDRA
jgi:hypothetical protein